MSERLTERELAEIGAAHVQFEMVTRAGGQYSDLLRYPACRECRTPWPCDVARLLAEVRALWARVEAAEQEGYERALVDVERFDHDWDTGPECLALWMRDGNDERTDIQVTLVHLRGECCCPKVANT